MNSKLIGMVTVALSGALSAQAAGFALYGASAKGMAMGGAVVAQAVDASANFYNPATLADFTNTVITAGLCLEVPRANTEVTTGGMRHSGRLNSGCFYLPHFYVAQPLPYGFTFGIGGAPEFGLGSAYGNGWAMNWNTTETTIEGFAVNPNLTYSVTDDWSVSAGFRILYLSFEQYSNPQVPGAILPQYPGSPYDIYQLRNHIKADNGFSDWGWTISSRYKILDNLSAGIMYRSYIDAKLRGDSTTTSGSVPEPWGNAVAGRASGRGGANVRLPQSITAGLNWDATETLHLGYGMTWTRWSSLDQIIFNIPPEPKRLQLKWKDVFRFSFGAGWDFAENWTLLGSYIYDMDPCSTRKNIGSTMLPAGDRHLLTTGLAWHWQNWEISACYGLILMDGRPQKYSDELGREYRFSTSAGRSHQLGFSLSYYF